MKKLKERKLTQEEINFIENKIVEWQKYEKNIKIERLGLDRRKLSLINVEKIIEQCIIDDFNDEKF